jgi:hypothetical protein
MKRLEQFAACTLFMIAAIWGPSLLLAQSPLSLAFTRFSPQVSPNPNPKIFAVDHGRYHCGSCKPVIDVPANGADQRVDGYADGQVYDMISVRIISPNTVEVTTKRAGRIFFRQISTVSADGNTLYVKTTEFPEFSEKPVTGEATAMRVGAAPSGAHAASGSWRAIKVSTDEN